MSNLYRGPSIDASYQISVSPNVEINSPGCRVRGFFNPWTAKPIDLKFGRKHLWKAPYKDCSFRPNPLTNMATTGNSCFWLADLKKSSPLKPLGQMNWNLVGSIYGRSSIKFARGRIGTRFLRPRGTSPLKGGQPRGIEMGLRASSAWRGCKNSQPTRPADET